MYKILSGSTIDFPDTAGFLDLIERVPDHFFDPRREVVVTRAPGRLDLMGGIADYSGSLVLQLPIADATHVALQPQPAQVLNIVSLSINADDAPRTFEMPLADFLVGGQPIEYTRACDYFKSNSEHRWAAYVAGVFPVLMREKGTAFDEGARILISSAVPEGKGVSSSAALEVATMKAVVPAYGLEMSARELALLCRQTENLVAGAPCGVMDQMTAACGERNKLLALLCQPAELKDAIELPEELEVWGIDSGIRHSVSDDKYRNVRTGAFMGYQMIAEMIGLQCRETEPAGVLEVHDDRWAGYLANISPEEFEFSYAPYIPEQMTGAEFLKRYRGITDSVTAVNPESSYHVLAATRHPIHEHARVKTFAAVLQNWHSLSQAETLGALMYESHQSYGTCDLGSKGTDEIIALARAARGIFGAKITGGGSGGTVAVLGQRGSMDELMSIANEYANRTGLKPTVISGSSPGAEVFGYLRLKKETTPALA